MTATTGTTKDGDNLFCSFFVGKDGSVDNSVWWAKFERTLVRSLEKQNEQTRKLVH